MISVRMQEVGVQPVTTGSAKISVICGKLFQLTLINYSRVKRMSKFTFSEPEYFRLIKVRAQNILKMSNTKPSNDQSNGDPGEASDFGVKDVKDDPYKKYPYQVTMIKGRVSNRISISRDSRFSVILNKLLSCVFVPN